MDPSTLAEALELGSLVLPAVPGQAEYLTLPGMVARSSPIPSPFVNLAGRMRLDSTTADAALMALHEHYAERRLPFGVMLGASSRPTDLPLRLETLGLRHVQRCEGLVLTDLAQPIASEPDVLVTQIGPGRRAVFDRIKAESFGMPLAVAERIGDLLFGASRDVVFHLAYRNGEPVGFAQTFYYRQVAILGGAGVIPAARGQGAFRSLLALRLRQAQRDGMRAATIQAYDHTSAPILKRLGFTLHDDLHLWAYEA